MSAVRREMLVAVIRQRVAPERWPSAIRELALDFEDRAHKGLLGPDGESYADSAAWLREREEMPPLHMVPKLTLIQGGKRD
ncbi:MAG: hypothetical protein ACREPK_09045 [Rhodanobacteraceae bacterium]